MKRILTALILSLCFTFCTPSKASKAEATTKAEVPLTKEAIRSKLALKATLLTYNPDTGERPMKLTFENNSDEHIAYFVVQTMLYNAEGKAIFYAEADTIDAFGFQPRHRRDFIPQYYKGHKTIDLKGVEELETLKQAATVQLEITEVKLKTF